jgi:hypothetical protein
MSVQQTPERGARRLPVEGGQASQSHQVAQNTSIFQDLGCGVWLSSDDREEWIQKRVDVTPLMGLNGGKSIV